MQVRVWGTRGSLPTPMSSDLLRQKAKALLEEATPDDLKDEASIEALLDRSDHSWTFGGNSSCMEVSIPGHVYVLDAGTGARELSQQLFTDGRAHKDHIHVFFTHFSIGQIDHRFSLMAYAVAKSTIRMLHLKKTNRCRTNRSAFSFAI